MILTAVSNIKFGEAVTCSYGTYDTGYMFLNYGFIQENCNSDVTKVTLAVLPKEKDINFDTKATILNPSFNS